MAKCSSQVDYLASLNNRDGFLHQKKGTILEIQRYHTACNAFPTIAALPEHMLPVRMAVEVWNNCRTCTASGLNMLRPRLLLNVPVCTELTSLCLSSLTSADKQAGTFYTDTFVSNIKTYSTLWILTRIWFTTTLKSPNKKALLLLFLLTEAHFYYFVVLSATDVIPRVMSALSYS